MNITECTHTGLDGLARPTPSHTDSLLLLGCKPVQHVTTQPHEMDSSTREDGAIQTRVNTSWMGPLPE